MPGVPAPRRRARKRVASGGPRPQAPTGPNQVWAYDFVFDRCANGQQLKCLTVSDEWTKEGLAIEVDGRIRSQRVEWFRSRAEAKVVIECWRRHYNAVRPHSSLGYLTPEEFVAKHRQTTDDLDEGVQLRIKFRYPVEARGDKVDRRNAAGLELVGQHVDREFAQVRAHECPPFRAAVGNTSATSFDPH